ncbi:L-ascorbate metabolism protein UlaG, beta-lactamase superfamily [Belliella buryatensis]|uniref:L-ascorbate metabolism protein UlaG, beta-lactamase superfamily n=1 Tax=Belliella buryatensis TaxID=1500549 RepID=A0A239EYP3_9BACT|nr:MBL fold metallo-hydrolase [Belliella buryatensis]SNS49707.1 L-ascorbate metabolism protein UlaG, beta-lactamase superfamily [Belliella buryatensis]
MKRKYIFALLIPALLLFMIIDTKEETITYTSNPNLKTTAPDENWKGNPIEEDRQFINLYHPFESSVKDLLKWKLSKNPQKEEKEADIRTLPISTETFDFESKEDYIIWLGHASYLIRLDGVTFITDPLLIDNLFLKRKSELPFPLAQFPQIDYLLLSHSHRDHCDKSSIKWLSEQNPNLKVLTGLGINKVIKNWLDDQEVQQAGWYQTYDLNDSNLSIHYVPSRHWSKRWLNDDNKSLWGGFYIQSKNQRIYFMGDSGAGPHFEDIKNTLGSPEYCLMGIGAYKPEWFMHQAHISPTDAIEAFNVLEGSYFIPMHYGTFDLSDEPLLEPWDVVASNQQSINGELIEPVLGKNLIKK